MYIIMNVMSMWRSGAPAHPLPANRSPSGLPTYRFSADGRRQAGDADTAIDEMLGRMKEAIVGITSPKGFNYGAEAEKMGQELLDICSSRIESFT